MTTTQQQIADALEPMRAAMAGAILTWMQNQVQHLDAELVAARAEIEQAVRATPKQCSPWNVPAWLNHGGKVYAGTVEDAIGQGMRHLGEYSLASRHHTPGGRMHMIRRQIIVESFELSRNRDKLPELANRQATENVAGMVAKLTNKLAAAGAIETHKCYGVSPDSFTLHVQTVTGRALRVETRRINNYRNGRPYWQWPSRISERLPSGAWRAVPAAKLAA